MPKSPEKRRHSVRKSVNFGKPVDRRNEFSAKFLEMSPILRFLPLNAHQPGPKGGEIREGLKMLIPTSSNEVPSWVADWVVLTV
ncbi:MAG: hypothetical protein JNK37_18985 [Verrucomicrobiales bacterium]|nr:hypothetical protein [Verrucomicrobiales bacterium]